MELNKPFVYLKKAKEVSERSTCLRRKVGAILIMENEYHEITDYTIGYNSAPLHMKNCIEKGTCLRQKLNIPSGERQELCYAVHAEQMAIAEAAKKHFDFANCTLYITTYPCSICAKLICAFGIKKIYYLDGYPDSLTESIFANSDISCIKM